MRAPGLFITACTMIAMTACAGRARNEPVGFATPTYHARTSAPGAVATTPPAWAIGDDSTAPEPRFQPSSPLMDDLQRRLDVAIAARDTLRQRFVAWGAIPRPPMPELLIEEPGEPPVAGARWTSGKWVWANGRWEWRDGYWSGPDDELESGDELFIGGDLQIGELPAIRDHRTGNRVRDHRNGRNDRVRDHRSDDTPTVRDHRSSSHASTPTPAVRDHRDDHDDTPRATIRDHRDDKDDDRDTKIRDHRR